MDKINWKKIGLGFLAFMGAFTAANAATSAVQKGMRGNAKFNVVAVVLGIIFLGITLFLFRLDRKIGKLEKEKTQNK